MNSYKSLLTISYIMLVFHSGFIDFEEEAENGANINETILSGAAGWKRAVPLAGENVPLPRQPLPSGVEQR